MPPSATPLSLAPASPCMNGLESSKPDTEKELKLVTANGSSEPFKLFTKDLDRGKIDGISVLDKASPHRLITRQIDTKDTILKQNGISLRIRGTYTDNGEFISPDVNIKTSLPNGELGMLRGEYEERIDDAGTVDLRPIEGKYAHKMESGLLPDLKHALSLIRDLSASGQLEEHFLIDTQRTRRVITLDPRTFGFANNQRFVGEMLSDKVRYHLRSAASQQTIEFAVNKGRRELELEPLHVPCAYNYYDGCEDHVCKGLDSLDEDLSLIFFREAVMVYAERTGHTIETADLSKSGRGFEAREKLTSFFNEIAQGQPSASSPLVLPPEIVNGWHHKSAPVKLVQNINVPWELKAA